MLHKCAANNKIALLSLAKLLQTKNFNLKSDTNKDLQQSIDAVVEKSDPNFAKIIKMQTTKGNSYFISIFVVIITII